MTIELDLSAVTTRDGLHDLLAEKLPLPEWYGRNLDALFDSLTDISQDMHISVVGFEAFRDAVGAYADGFGRVLTGAADSNSHITAEIN